MHGDPSGGGQDISVLHVDDDEDFLDLTANYLERENPAISVTSVSSASDALERLPDEHVDCVVSDYQMPEIDGLEFLRTVRDVHGELPFILFTGKGSEEVASDAIAAGVTDYLQKQGGADQYALLSNRIENAVERYHALTNYHEVFEKIPDGITIHHPEDGSILSANQQFCEMLGYDRQELLGAGFDEIHAGREPYTNERAEERIRAAARNGPQTFEWLDETSDGTELPVEVHLRQTTIDGAPRVLAVVRDITDRKERERDLSRYARLLEEVRDGVYALDTEGRYTYVNAYVEETTGYDREELIGAPPGKVLSTHDEGRFVDAIGEMLAGERDAFETEVEIQPKEGEPFRARARITILVEDGSWEGTVGVVRELEDPG